MDLDVLLPYAIIPQLLSHYNLIQILLSLFLKEAQTALFKDSVRTAQ